MKHIFTTLFVAFFWSACYCQDLIPIPTVEKPAAVLAAESVGFAINEQEKQIIAKHKVLWETTWENPRGATPQEVFNAFGANGYKVLLCGSAYVDLIEAIAMIKGTTAEQLLGDWKYTTTKYEISVSSGQVTVHMDQPKSPPQQ